MTSAFSAALLLLTAAGSAIAQEPAARGVHVERSATVELPPLPQRTADGRHLADVVQRCAGLVDASGPRANECTRAGLALSNAGHPAAVVLFAQACEQQSELGCQLAELSAEVPHTGWLTAVSPSVAKCETGDDMACAIPMQEWRLNPTPNRLQFKNRRRLGEFVDDAGRPIGLDVAGQPIGCDQAALSALQCESWAALQMKARTEGYLRRIGPPSLEGPSQGSIKVPAKQQ